MLRPWYLHLVEGMFSRVKELAYICKLESYASGSSAAVRATHAGQIWGELTDKERASPSRLGVGNGCDILRKNSIFLKPRQGEGLRPKRGGTPEEKKEKKKNKVLL